MGLDENEYQYKERIFGGPHYRVGGMDHYGEGKLEDRIELMVAQHEKKEGWALYDLHGNKRFGGLHEWVRGIKRFPNGLQLLLTGEGHYCEYFSYEGIRFSAEEYMNDWLEHYDVVNNFSKWEDEISYKGVNTKTLEEIKEWLIDNNNPHDYINIELVRIISQEKLLERGKALLGIDHISFLNQFSRELENPLYKDFFIRLSEHFIGTKTKTINPHSLDRVIKQSISDAKVGMLPGWFQKEQHQPYGLSYPKAEVNPSSPLDRLEATLQQNLFSSIEELGECVSLKLPNYHVISKHAEGGWSNVYLIIDKEETEEDFIKILKIPSKNLDNPNVQRIIQHYSSEESNDEERIVQALKSIAKEERKINSKTSSTSRDNFPNFDYRPLPQFHDSCFGEGRIPLLIYEYIRGETLEEYFKEEKSLEEQLDVLTRTAYALNYIHQKGFTHNDIKMDNFMRGENGRVYLLDLGLSQVTDTEISLKGKRAYLAPERIEGQSNPSEKSDQYGFGVMAYEALTGELPINFGETEEEKVNVAAKVKNGEIKAKILKQNKKVPESVATIIDRCLSFNPEERYDSMQDVENRLFESYQKMVA